MSSISKTWGVLPAKDLTIRSSWKKQGDLYSAIRVRLLIARHELDECRDGNIKESHPISVDSISIETAHQTVTVLTDTMTAGLRFVVSRRVLDQLFSKITSELGVKAAGFSAKLGSELLAKTEYEFIETTEEKPQRTKIVSAHRERREDAHDYFDLRRSARGEPAPKVLASALGRLSALLRSNRIRI